MTDQPTTQHAEERIVAAFLDYLNALAAAGATGEIDAHAGTPHLPAHLQKGTPITLAEALSVSARDVLFVVNQGEIAHVSARNPAAVQAFIEERRHLAQAVADGWGRHRRAADAG